jgi:hypothetical protein
MTSLARKVLLVALLLGQARAAPAQTPPPIFHNERVDQNPRILAADPERRGLSLGQSLVDWGYDHLDDKGKDFSQNYRWSFDVLGREAP